MLIVPVDLLRGIGDEESYQQFLKKGAAIF